MPLSVIVKVPFICLSAHRIAALLAPVWVVAALVAAPATADEFDLKQYRGKVVYVDFWASWCVPCRASFPWMNALQAELADEGFVIIGVNTGDSPAEAARFLTQIPAEFEIVTDDEGRIAKAYELKGMPMAYIYDREGNLVESHIGFNKRSGSQRAAAITRLVHR